MTALPISSDPGSTALIPEVSEKSSPSGVEKGYVSVSLSLHSVFNLDQNLFIPLLRPEISTVLLVLRGTLFLCCVDFVKKREKKSEMSEF